MIGSVSILAAGMFFGSCAWDEGCACTAELRFNVCATVNGHDSIPEGLTLLRKAEGRVDTLGGVYSLATFSGRGCFTESPGKNRFLLKRGDSVVAESGEFFVKTVDCCHGEDKTVDLPAP